MRKSEVIKLEDSAGKYEQEIFHSDDPKIVIVGIHGNGVRRWDGEKFFYQVAEEFSDCAVFLVDQNQTEENGVRLNSLDTMVTRNQELIKTAKSRYPESEIWIISHSMGCGINARLDLSDISGSIFVAPTAGDFATKYTARYGDDVWFGKIVKSRSKAGTSKNITKEFMDSVKSIDWDKEYKELLSKYPNIHVFESGAEEIVGEERFELRDMPFASYDIIEGAKHNFEGSHSKALFSKIRKII